MAKQYSRREILSAIMLGGGVIAGELWWPGQKLISIPTTDEVLRYTATERYSHGWTDPRGGFGLAQAKPEGGVVHYDADRRVFAATVDIDTEEIHCKQGVITSSDGFTWTYDGRSG